MTPPAAWLNAWEIFHWICLSAAAIGALFLLLHSVTFHRLKRRMADLLLSGIALADLGFVVFEALKQLAHTSYFARYRQEDEGEDIEAYSTKDFILTLMARFSFFMSFYWIANLSLLMRLGNMEALQVRRSAEANPGLPTHEVKIVDVDTPSSSVDGSTGALTDGGTPGSTGYAGFAAGGVLGIRDGLLAGGPIAEMVTEGPAMKIGEGSSAEVYKGQWLGITVALKCLRLQAAGGSEAELYMTHLAELRTEFLDEAVLAAQLRHPNITLFIKMGTYRGSLCLVNEYCSRGSLRDVLRANPLIEWHTKVRLAFEAAKGLAFMHNREPIYLHRDLKASNILVTADWTAKIADFGIARIATDFTAKKQHISRKFSGEQSLVSLQSIAESDVIMDNAASELMTTFAGTWRWNAPEIMKNPNECRFNRETDMYSFGVALWELLTNGAVPFGNVDFDHQVRQLVAAGERPAMPTTAYLRRAPPEFVEVMCACWHQEPKKRPTAQDVMLRLGSLSYTLSQGSEFYTTSQNTARFVFSDNYYQAMDSGQSCLSLW
ncbi:hypothetical protein BBI17_007842 [Phytophthora kernoviae]|uniref:Protein kinase domain-containing protein n=1 Tax=Phytophthora kernoviae TaxID=325452 RepID=A0A3R7MUA2_9STRA|nr:hypothetical protein BBI17_007842 [Phytophthora kernoviae]